MPRTRLRAAARDHLDAMLTDASPQRERGHRGLLGLVKAAVVVGLTGDDGGPDPALVAAASGWLAELEARQAPTGLFSSGDNLASPPDSAFTVTDGAVLARVLARHPWPGDLAARLDGVLDRSLPALTAGGVHTPNHRWELAGALAAAGTLRGDGAALDRARDWLGEGVDADADALFSERSANYAAHVTVPSLLTLAADLDRPDLAELAHAALHTQLDLTDSADLVETVHSRRQDQHERYPLGPFAPLLLHTGAGCPRCLAAAAAALEAPGTDPVHVLAQDLIDPLTTAALDALTDAPDAVGPWRLEGERRFAGPRLLVRRTPDAELTLYAGSDVPAVGRIASGLACDPTFGRARLGAVRITSMRLARDFFSTGPMRATALEVDGASVRLTETVAAGYYQPLAPADRRADADYALEFEGRFAAAMAFSRRAVDELVLTTAVTVTQDADGVTLAIEIGGPDLPVSLELGLADDVGVTGARPLPARGAHAAAAAWSAGPGTTLAAGDTRVEVRTEADLVEPGPGPLYSPGEAYTFLGGTDAVTSPCLYVTFRAPGTARVRLERV